LQPAAVDLPRHSPECGVDNVFAFEVMSTRTKMDRVGSGLAGFLREDRRFRHT
jgi:hypothetical protein